MVFDRVFSRKDEDNIEEFLNNLDTTEENLYEDADALVKPMALTNEGDAAVACEELRKGNFVLLNVMELQKRNKGKLKELLDTLKMEVAKINGDIAGISADRILATPAKVKIVKRRE